MLRNLHKRLCMAALFGLLAPAAHAELGDYSVWQTAWNLVSPPSADNRVTAAQSGAAQYPLLDNPSGFNDGFSAGKYGVWQTITMSPDSDSTCSDGSPYKFFVNRAPNTSNMLIYFEPGGACWDYESCTNPSGSILGARNPHGIPDNYMSLLNPGASLVTPFVTRVSPFEQIKTQNWNIVYVPYCTGDVFGGDKVAVYTGPNAGDPTNVFYHNGVRNTRSVVAWLKNHLQRPAQLFITGSSAGGVGSLVNYYPFRRDMAPDKAFLIDDSGPLMDAPAGGDPTVHPSIPLHTQIRTAWNVAAPIAYLAAELTALDPNNFGTIYAALSQKLPNDRMGLTHFWQDAVFSDYSYGRFFADIINAPDATTRSQRINARWTADTADLRNTLAGLSNFGGYFPQYRALNKSHCTEIVDFKNGDIQERNLQLRDFINSVLDGSGPILQASETSPAADYAKPFNLLYWTVDQILGN